REVLDFRQPYVDHSLVALVELAVLPDEMLLPFGKVFDRIQSIGWQSLFNLVGAQALERTPESAFVRADVAEADIVRCSVVERISGPELHRPDGERGKLLAY